MKKVAMGFLIVMIIVPLAGYIYLRTYLPNYNSKRNLPSLDNEVTIKRNRFAVPSITAENLEDLYFAWGYVNAQDRMFQMEVTKRIGQGRISEFAGQSTLPKDIFLRAVGFYDIAKTEAAKLPAKYKVLLQRYVDGINCYLETEKKPLYMTLLGIHKEKWSPADSVLVGLMLNWSLAYNMRNELLYHKISGKIGKSRCEELLNFIPSDTPAIAAAGLQSAASDHRLAAMLGEFGPLAGGHSASNNWVVAPSKTACSGPILACDPHLATKIPADLYLVHLKAGDFEVAGAQIAGLPIIAFGYNPYMAWGNTNQGADIVDCYFETINWDKKTYIRNGEEYPLNSKDAEIRIKGKDPVKKTLYYAGRRPLLNEVFTDLEEIVSLDWAGFEGLAIEGFFDLNRARNYSEFIAAVSKIGMTPQNMVYADVEGNIAYRTIGNLVKRKSGTGNFPQAGQAVEANWDGLLDPNMNPSLLNPPQGYIVTANNKVVDDFVIDINGTYAPRYRYEAILNMIAANHTIDLKYTQKMQCDTNSVLFKKLKPILKNCVETGDDLNARQALDLVLAWDGDVKTDLAAPSIYNTWLVRFMYLTYVDELGKDLANTYITQRYISLERFLSLVEKGSAFFDDIRTPEKESVEDMATRAFKDALQILADFTGSNKMNDWKWGRVHPIRFEHFLGKSRLLRPLVNYGPFPLGGDCETNLRAQFHKAVPPFTAELTAALRLVVQFDPKPKGYMVLISGQNEYFLSKHYTDLTDMWMQGGYFCLEEEKAKYEMVLNPIP